MEKFMLIFQGGQLNHLSPEELQAQLGKWMAWIDRLAKEGRYESGEPLIQGGKLVSGPKGQHVIDGPYTEGKEVVGGYFLIKAKDMDEAVAISKDYPDFEFGGTVQVRKVMKMDM